MLSLQGMIAKDLDAQGVLPQKFKDLTLRPKYPLIKFVNYKGIVPTADALPVSAYRFVNEDGSDLDFMNASWELQIGWYCTAVWNSGSTGIFELRFSDNVRLLDFLAKVRCYRTGSSAVEIYNYSNGGNSAYNYKPTWVYMKLTHTKNSTSVNYSFKKSTSSKAQAKSSQWSSGSSIYVADMSTVGLSVYRCGTAINTTSDNGHNSGQVYLGDMKFTYNDRVILGE